MLGFGKIGSFLKKHRINAEFKTIGSASSTIHFGEATISRFENNHAIPDQSSIIHIANMYNVPELIPLYCKCCCKVGHYHHIDPPIEMIDINNGPDLVLGEEDQETKLYVMNRTKAV